MIRTAAAAATAAMLAPLAPVAAADPPAYQFPFTCNQASLTADFAQRDALPQTSTPQSQWYQQKEGRYVVGAWGPAAARLPAVAVPGDAGCDATTWKQQRIVSAAMHYLNTGGNPQGLQYRHHHIPAWDPPTSTAPAAAAEKTADMDGRSAQTWDSGRGLDCSNFTSWVYNYGLGIKFGGDVDTQWAGTAGPMGQKIDARGPFQPGDLLFLHPQGNTDEVSHTVVFLDDGHVIDSRLTAEGVDGVQIRERTGWYSTAVVGGWRPIAA